MSTLNVYKLGWIISGSVGSSTCMEMAQSCHITTKEDVSTLLRKFWEVEEISSSNSQTLTPDEQQCEDHFQANHSRDLQGRYIVKLPFQRSPAHLGDSKGRAIQILHRLAKRLASDQKYSQLYTDFINDYEALHHMELVPDSMPDSPAVCYLPHHGVLKETSDTTKLRVVFIGSSCTTSGLSLNDLLYVGPKLQMNLFDVLIWFRQFRFVFSSDLEKMYRQIKIHNDDCKFQRILWMNASQQIQTYQLMTVTYGIKCAPFLALRVMNQLIKDEGQRFPLAIPVLTYGRYVDDLFGGADSLEETREIIRQTNQLCTAGGFRPRKWISRRH